MKSRALLFVGLLCFLVLMSSTLAAETSKDKKAEADNVKEPEKYGGRCRYGCCGRRPFGCSRCCKSAEEAESAEVSVGVDGYGGGGGWGGGGGGRGGGGGWGGGGGRGGGGGHCRYGCCGGGGRYCRCCYNQEEAEAVMYGN